MEVEFCKMIDWNLSVQNSELQKYYVHMVNSSGSVTKRGGCTDVD
jgi:hypothetical protein